MRISGLQKLSLLDYPGKMAAIVFTQGCNFRCPFCQNGDLLNNEEGLLKTKEILDYLNLRRKVLDGIVITGGEPTLQTDLKSFIIECRKLGLAIKLDTNGSNPTMLKELLDENLLDYVAIDIKNVFGDYEAISGIRGIDVDKIRTSIDLIKKSSIEHEFRTTIVRGYHDVEKLIKIAEFVKPSIFFVQNFENSEGVLDKSLEGFSQDELRDIDEKLRKKCPNASVRGLNKLKEGKRNV